jgi:hypothetical protein
MMEAIFRLSGRRKILKPVLLLILVVTLMWSSILWAGPMGDPEPVGLEDARAPIAPSTDPQPQSAMSMLNLDLAIVLVGILF